MLTFYNAFMYSKLTVAELSHISGVCRSTITAQLYGYTTPTLNTAYKLAKALGFEAQDLWPELKIPVNYSKRIKSYINKMLFLDYHDPAFEALARLCNILSVKERCSNQIFIKEPTNVGKRDKYNF